jgi:hypothetical protein
MNAGLLTEIRGAVCAVGISETTEEKLLADPQRFKFHIEGTGFLTNARTVLTCAHVVDALESAARKRRARPHAKMLQFILPPSGSDHEWKMVVRPFEVARRDDRVDLALLRLDKSVIANPVAMVSQDCVPSVGEPIGLCGYAHGSLLTTWAGKMERFGPLFQVGVVSAVMPFDVRQPDRVILDLVTGPAASGSPVFRQEDGRVVGFLVEGQIKGSAAFSIARLIFGDSAGRLTARLLAEVRVARNDE